MAIFKIHKETNYTTIDNDIFKNKNLSSKSVGILCTMLSLPSDWDFTELGLCTIRNESRTLIRSALKELEDSGYLVRVRNRNEKGQLTTTTYDVYEKPMYQKPTLVLPTLEKDTQLNTNIINNLNNKKKEIYKERFIKPTIEEIKTYCDERGNNVNPNKFYDFYESKGWLIGKNKMKDWKACVRTWERGNRLPTWFNKQNENKKPTNEELEEMNKILGELGNEKT